MKRKIRVAVLCGGRSAEHEISLLSAQNVIQALDKEKYEVIVIGIDQQGKWFLQNPSGLMQHNRNLRKLKHSGTQLGYALDNSKEPVSFSSSDAQTPLDVIFPVLHGPYGEDGTVQGFLKLAGVPFVGASVLGSAIGMDKDVMKRLLREAGIPVAKFLVFHTTEIDTIRFDRVREKLGLPFFVKPANLGSSIGISKVHTQKEFKNALKIACSFDTKILIEQEIVGREIECSILGNNTIRASVPGEVIAHDEFYSYNAKYIDPNGAELRIPADLPGILVRRIQNLAEKTARVLCIEGMARVDFFLKSNGEVLVNEINTIPGFTDISMYPKLWEVSGVSYAQLLDTLIQLALQRHMIEQKLKTRVIV